MKSASIISILLQLGQLLAGVTTTTRQTIPENESHAREVCSRITQIKMLPMKPNEGDLNFFKGLDPAYGQFRELGEAAVPCLIGKLTDRAVMNDPRQAPRVGPVTVGDVALWVFCDITGMQLQQALPAAIRRDYKERGEYAYLDWVRADSKHRKIVQQNVTKWYSEHSSRKMPKQVP
ncbi:MAG TPA: hypothetical protein VFR84_14320 [Candidatus Angelobacter sp.]|nr:hypothetical protein [Candidatus Angelobacter sp.]